MSRISCRWCVYMERFTLLNDLHWLRVPERTTYKLCVLVYNCLHGTAPRYLQDAIQPIAEVTSRRRLQSASSSALVVPATRRSSLGDRAFAVAGPREWNSLPEFVTDCSSPHLSHSRNISRLIYLVCLFRARIDCVERLSSSLGRLRRYKLVKLHYITLPSESRPTSHAPSSATTKMHLLVLVGENLKSVGNF